VVGQIQLATFTNENGLDAMGQNLFTPTTASGDAMLGTPNTTGYGSVMQGYVENSNVNVVTEITDLITAQRAYEMNSKVITSADDLYASGVPAVLNGLAEELGTYFQKILSQRAVDTKN
jgi:flagellar basal-body rod protein FlgG